jgi:hypothetical protein
VFKNLCVITNQNQLLQNQIPRVDVFNIKSDNPSFVNFKIFHESLMNLLGPTFKNEVDYIFQLNPSDLSNTGANRNFSLLFNSGSKFIMMDDDVELQFSSYRLSRIDIHSSKYDRSINTLISEETFNEICRSNVAIKDITDELEINFTDDIKLYAFGHFGSSGTSNYNHYLKSYKKITDEDYLIYRRYQESKPQRNWNIMMPCCGINAKNKLPPFVPVGRGQDQSFQVAISVLDREALTFFSKYSVLHKPKTRKLKYSSSINLNTFICSIWQEIYNQSYYLSFKEAGDFFLEMTKNRYHFWSKYSHHIISSKINELEMIQSREIDDQTTQFITSEIENLKTLSNKNFVLPIEVSTISQLDFHISSYGNTLKKWDDIWEASLKCSQG